MMYAAACRRDCSVSRLPSVIIFSATGRVAFARVKVVVIRPCSNKLVTRFRSVARRCDGLRPSFDPELRCRIVYPFSFCCLATVCSFKQAVNVFLSASLRLRRSRLAVESGRKNLSLDLTVMPRSNRKSKVLLFPFDFQLSTVNSLYSPTVSSLGGGAVWLGSGGQIIRPCSSNFMPRLRPILVSISLISLSDFLPKFLVFSISFSLFCTSSRIVWMFAFFKQL